VTGVRLRDRAGAVGQDITGEDRGAFPTFEGVRLESKQCGKRPVERDKARLADRSRYRV
jgi:hypothetical protein